MTAIYEIDVECPVCKKDESIKLNVGIEYDGDESGVWPYLDFEERRQDCECILDDEWDGIHDTARNIYNEIYER